MTTSYEDLAAREAVRDRIVELFVATDERAWDRVRACFADTVRFDMTSLAGGEAQELTADQIATAWEEALGSVDAAHHQAGNFQIEIEGNSAEAKCYGVAYHFTAGDGEPTITTFVGTYELGLVQHRGDWEIEAFRFNAKFVDSRTG